MPTPHVRYQIKQIDGNCTAIKFDKLGLPASDSSIPVVYVYNQRVDAAAALAIIMALLSHDFTASVETDLFCH